MNFKVAAPLRIDFCGGYTDIGEICQITGTAIANLAIDLYWDEARTQPVTFEVVTCTDQLEPRLIDEAERQLLQSLGNYGRSSLGVNVEYTRCLRFNSQVPVSMGLGTSSAVSVMLTSAAQFHQGWHMEQVRQQAFQEAQIFEKEVLQVKGGFQDFIPAIYGGYNYITAKAEDEDLQLVKNPATVSIQNDSVNPAMTDYCDRCLFIIYALRRSSSSKIIDDIVTKSQQQTDIVEVARQIYHYNQMFHQQFTAIGQELPTTPINGVCLPCCETSMLALTDCMNQAWQVRQQFSALAQNDILEAVEQAVAEDIYCAHGVGAGGSVLVLYGKPDRLTYLQTKLRDLIHPLNITLFYPKINHTGLTYTVL